MTALWYHDHGVRVFPLQPRSKEPAVKWVNYRATRKHVSTFGNYGVPLGTVHRPDGTFDCWGVVDTDNPQAEGWVFGQIEAGHMPPTPFVVRTGKGVHRYYRLRKPVPKFLHREGLTIEFRNEGQYVVGPGSVHPSGAIYTAEPWDQVWESIPVFPEHYVFDDGSCGQRSTSLTPGAMNDAEFVLPDQIHSGERHDMLFRAIRSMKALGTSPADAYEMILEANRNCCTPPLAESQLDQRWFMRGWNNTDRPIGRILRPVVTSMKAAEDDV